MIPPTRGEMAPPPSWYDEVIDLSLDEARGLVDMGVTVYMAWSGSVTWNTRPRLIHVQASHIFAGHRETVLFFVLKEESDDST